MNFPRSLLMCAIALLLSGHVHGQTWLERVSATQSEQPHWMTPVATVTPRLEQEFRFDVMRQVTTAGDLTNLDSGKGLELIPTHRTELLINLPPYLVHEDPASRGGWGDASFTLKYRFFSRPEQKGNVIVTGFLGGSVPTGSHKNGSISAIVTPTLAAGKGWRWFDVQSTLAGTLPVDSVNKLGHTIASNTAFQAHAFKKLWPEIEINSTAWAGGSNDGKKQTFLTPGIVFGRFPIHRRMAFAFGLGFQIAATHYHQYNHGFIATLRMPF